MSLAGIYSKNVLTQDGFKEATILFKNGKISEIKWKEKINDTQIEDFGSLTVMPGLVDSHVHINEPGRTEWEGFTHATQAAAAGGVTSLVDMPLNCIPVTTSLAALKEKISAVKDKLWTDTAFHGGVIPGNEDELEPMIQAGVKTFKAFMIDSGIVEFPASTPKSLEKAMRILKKHDATLLVHAEMESCIAPSMQNSENYNEYLKSRPDEWEISAIQNIIELSKSTGCQTHIVHLSTHKAVALLSSARAQGIPISVETCPHYLSLYSEDIPNGDARYKCAPPIRNKKNSEGLWQGLLKSHIDFIVSDHSPCTPQLKRLAENDLEHAWGGVASLQLTLPIIWTEMLKRKLPALYLLPWLCEAPAKLARLSNRKGQIAVGMDADILVWNPNQEVLISEKNLLTKHTSNSPYLGKKLTGTIEHTFLRGQKSFTSGKVSNHPRGTLLL
jgi:allantoinase